MQYSSKGGKKCLIERFTVSGNNLVEKVKELVRQGNISRVRLIHEEKALTDIPLSVGVPAVLIESFL